MNIYKKYRREICRLLIEEPDQWKFEYSWAKHKTKPIRIWIANGCYGLDWHYGTVSEVRFATFWFLVPGEWWRYRMLKLAEKVYHRQASWGV
jgi:hypothetical protein